eukprot:gene16603-biopygen12823
MSYSQWTGPVQHRSAVANGGCAMPRTRGRLVVWTSGSDGACCMLPGQLPRREKRPGYAPPPSDCRRWRPAPPPHEGSRPGLTFSPARFL